MKKLKLKSFRFVRLQILNILRFLLVFGYLPRIPIHRSQKYKRNLFLNRKFFDKDRDDSICGSAHNLRFTEFLLYAPEFIFRNGQRMESDFYFAYKNSLKELNLNVKTCDTLSDLEKVLVPRQTMLIIEGYALSTLSASQLQELSFFRKKGGFVFFDHPDLLESKKATKILSLMFQTADFGVIHNPLINIQRYKNRLILWPTYPFSNIFKNETVKEKENSILFSGTKYRGFNGRKFFLNYALKQGLNVTDHMHNHNLTEKILPRYTDYLSSLDSCNLSFTTGYRSFKESLLAFRVVELMLRGVVVLYEEQSIINFFFDPYEHYIPVQNGPDLCEKVTYLFSNPESIRRIAKNAAQYVDDNYSNSAFWQIVENKTTKL